MKTFHNFATASLSELYNISKIGTSKRFEANTLATGIFINSSEDEKLQLDFNPLPNIAQLSPSFGITLADIDTDGNIDIFLAQNFYSPQIETRPMDNALSLVLLGDGTGNFTPLTAEESGITLPGDSKSLSWGDLDGDGYQELLVTTNDGPIHSFSVHPAKGDEPRIKVTLIGDDKNPDAIGSRLFIEKGDTKLFRTIKSGSGYLSQSTNQITVSNEFVGGNIIIKWPNSKKTTHVIPANTENFMISY